MAMSEIISNYQKPAAIYQALPPAAQEAREKNEILKHPRLKELTGDEPVLEIRKINDGYLVFTDSKEIFVGVAYIHQDHICGPAKFELIFP